jgi:outer membrane receptor protein involved in Fe transport
VKKTNFSKLKVGVAPIVLGVALISAPAVAQDVQADEEAAPGEAIIVTGSRIASPQAESNAPIQIVNSEAIQQSGVTNIQEILLKNPAFGTPALSRTNSAFLTSGTGVATIDLRDLGSNRTLVLVNGRRVVSSLSGSSTVDLNVIPTQFIERVDVLTGGASSLYGSDAVAGVVNFVYKKDFQGLEGNAQYGVTERGDDIRYQANLTMGANFDDGRGNIMVHLGYSNERGLLSRQRSNTFTDDSDTSALTGDLADYGIPTEPFYSSFSEQGRFFAGDYSFTYSPTGQLQPCFTTNGPTCSSDLGTGVGPNGFNRQYYRTLAVPVKRYTFAAVGHYDVTDNISMFFEGTYNKTQSSRIIEPFALSSDGTTGIYPASGVMPIENYIIAPDGTTTIAVNPIVPGAIAAQATDTDGDGLRDIGFTRRLSEFGTRNGQTTRDFLRFVVGFEGTLGERFNWDLSYNYGQVTENQVSNGQVNVTNFRNALAAMTDVNDVNGNGLTTDVVCVSAEARANGCVPINIFGKGAITQDAIQYIAAQQSLQTDIKQQVVQGNISGSLFELPGGPLGVALGFEYRKEESLEDNDALTNQGLNAGNKLPDTSGQFDVLEAYAEVKLPILRDKPFFQLLEVGGAFRVADYSTVGTIYSYSAQGTWEPFDGLRFRGTWARAVRAPNIGELYSGLSQTFPSGLQDPCVGIGATGGGALGDNCRADAGVAANIAANGTFTLTQPDIQGISGFNGGNPNLKEEKADSWTLGAVINPRSVNALRNLTLSVDYYNIKINNIIATVGRGTILDQCYNEGNSTLCDLVIRRPTNTATNSAGSIEFINDLAVNAASLKTQGLDVTVNWYTPVNFFNTDGRVSFNLSYNHLFQNDYTPLPGATVDRADGEIGTAADRFTGTLGYSTDKFKWSFTGTFIGKSYEDDVSWCAFFGDGSPRCVSVPAQFYLDTQVSFTPVEKFEFYLGVDNLLDKKAPNILTNTTFNVTGSDTAADVYDIFGRRYYAGVRFHF